MSLARKTFISKMADMLPRIAQKYRVIRVLEKRFIVYLVWEIKSMPINCETKNVNIPGKHHHYGWEEDCTLVK